MSSARPAVDVWLRRTTDPGWASGVLRARAAALAGVPVSAVAVAHLCPRCGSAEHGRPHLLVEGRSSPWTVSLSRTPRLCAAALGRGGADVGVDVEEVGRRAAETVRAVARHPAERADGPHDLARLWTRKEALLKALGVGLAMDPATVRLTDPPGPARVLDCAALVADGRPAQLVDLDPGPGLVGCVAVLAHQAPTVSVGEAAPAAGSSSATR